MDHSAHEHVMDILFHPYLVHFPIAFFFLEALLLGMWIWKRDDKYESFAYLILKLAMLSMPFVMLAGYIDAGGIIPKVQLHFYSASTLFVLGLIRLIIRVKLGSRMWQSKARNIFVTLLIIGVVVTGLTGHLGALMVYND